MGHSLVNLIMQIIKKKKKLGDYAALRFIL